MYEIVGFSVPHLEQLRLYLSRSQTNEKKIVMSFIAMNRLNENEEKEGT
jgi:hypothetical protein